MRCAELAPVAMIGQTGPAANRGECLDKAANQLAGFPYASPRDWSERQPHR
jgi:hypothetical protein